MKYLGGREQAVGHVPRGTQTHGEGGSGRGGCGRPGASCAQRRAGFVVVATKQHVDLRHFLSQVARLLTADVVSRRVRRERNTVAQPVELDVLLQILGLKDGVGRVPRHAEQLVRVEVHDLIQVLLEDHDRAPRILVGRDDGEALAGEADDRVHCSAGVSAADEGARRGWGWFHRGVLRVRPSVFPKPAPCNLRPTSKHSELGLICRDHAEIEPPSRIRYPI